MTAREAVRCGYLDRLAHRLLSQVQQPSQLSCRELCDSFRFAGSLADRDVPAATLRAVAQEYAGRLNQLGEEEFDRRALLALPD